MIAGASLPNWEEFKEYILSERGRSVNSSFKSNFLFIKQYFEEKEFNKQNFRHFITKLRSGEIKGDLSLATINKYISVAKHIASYLELTFLNDYKSFPDEGRRIIRNILNKYELNQIIECNLERSRDTQETNRRYKAILATLIYTGMRPHELCNLKWEDYNGLQFELFKTKTHTPRKVPVVSRLKPLIDKLPHYPHSYIFGSRQGKLKPQSINTELHTRCVQLGWTKHITAYDLRHTFDTLCILNGGEKTLKEIARVSGHSIETCYKIYLDMDVAHLKDVIESTHPLLSKSQNIDSFKRVVVDMLGRLIDTSNYVIDLSITPKEKRERHITLS